MPIAAEPFVAGPFVAEPFAVEPAVAAVERAAFVAVPPAAASALKRSPF